MVKKPGSALWGHRTSGISGECGRPGAVPLVLDLRIAHDRFGSSSNPDLNGKLHWPNDMDKSLNEAAADKIRKYRATIIITPLMLPLLCRLLPVRLGGSIVNLSEFYSYSLIGKLTAFLQLQEFSQRNQIWEHSSTFAARLSLRCLNHASHRVSLRRQLYVLILT